MRPLGDLQNPVGKLFAREHLTVECARDGIENGLDIGKLEPEVLEKGGVRVLVARSLGGAVKRKIVGCKYMKGPSWPMS